MAVDQVSAHAHGGEWVVGGDRTVRVDAHDLSEQSVEPLRASGLRRSIAALGYEERPVPRNDDAAA
jgi:hypothetical protein